MENLARPGDVVLTEEGEKCVVIGVKTDLYAIGGWPPCAIRADKVKVVERCSDDVCVRTLAEALLIKDFRSAYAERSAALLSADLRSKLEEKMKTATVDLNLETRDGH